MELTVVLTLLLLWFDKWAVAFVAPFIDLFAVAECARWWCRWSGPRWDDCFCWISANAHRNIRSKAKQGDKRTEVKDKIVERKNASDVYEANESDVSYIFCISDCPTINGLAHKLFNAIRMEFILCDAYGISVVYSRANACIPNPRETRKFCLILSFVHFCHGPFHTVHTHSGLCSAVG